MKSDSHFYVSNMVRVSSASHELCVQFTRGCVWNVNDHKRTAANVMHYVVYKNKIPITIRLFIPYTWWRHQMEPFSALLAMCAWNSPVTCEFPTQRLGTQNFEVLFDLRLNKQLSKQSWDWWFETPSCSLWRHRNDFEEPKATWMRFLHC